MWPGAGRHKGNSGGPPTAHGDGHNRGTTGITQREGNNEKMKKITFMVGKYEKIVCVAYCNILGYF